jgi:hypothetical protein
LRATGDGIAEIVARYPQCQRVDSKHRELVQPSELGPDKVAAERVQILKHNMGFTTEVSGDWSCINQI